MVFVRGKPGNFPLTGSDLTSHWFVWKLRGNGKGEGREREGWGRPPALLPPTGFCLKDHPACDRMDRYSVTYWLRVESLHSFHGNSSIIANVNKLNGAEMKKIVGLFWLKFCIIKNGMVLGNWWRNFQQPKTRQKMALIGNKHVYGVTTEAWPLYSWLIQLSWWCAVLVVCACPTLFRVFAVPLVLLHTVHYACHACIQQLVWFCCVKLL